MNVRLSPLKFAQNGVVATIGKDRFINSDLMRANYDYFMATKQQSHIESFERAAADYTKEGRATDAQVLRKLSADLRRSSTELLGKASRVFNKFSLKQQLEASVAFRRMFNLPEEQKKAARSFVA